MDFETLIRRFNIIFSFCGITPFDAPTRSAHKWKKTFAQLFPAIFYLLTSIALFAAAICYRDQFILIFSKSNFGIVSIATAFTRLFIELLLQLVFIGQAIIFRERMKKLYHDYDYIQNYMKTRMKHNIDFNVFQRRFFQLTITVFLPHLTTIVLRRVLVDIRFKFVIFLNVFSLFYSLASVVQIYIIVHVELLRFFVMQMTNWLREQVSELSKPSLCARKDLRAHQINGYNKILQLKFLHFKLWKLSLDFNRIFGWSLAALILRNSTEIAYGIYWIYLNSIKGARFKFMLRKFT